MWHGIDWGVHRVCQPVGLLPIDWQRGADLSYAVSKASGNLSMIATLVP
jgi:hypothetical protein